MKLGIMQPYFFPYLGYFQLINAVDAFVFYDDVSFIKQGWINRNNFLIDKKKTMISVPIRNISSNKDICDTVIDEKQYGFWKKKFEKSIHHSYSKSSYYYEVSKLLDEVLYIDKFPVSIGDFNVKGLKKVIEYLGISVGKVMMSSEEYNNKELSGVDRVYDICRKEGASVYINSIGGEHLYQKEDFEKKSLKLQFIKPHFQEYEQFDVEFTPGLSIIDVMMFNSPERIFEMLSNYELL